MKKKERIDRLVELMTEIEPLAEYLLSDECSRRDRSNCRSRVGAEKFFSLANILNGLCGETSREICLKSRR